MMSSVDDNHCPLAADGPNVTLTMRLLMQGKEVGSIIGRGGSTVKKFREESQAKINISDSSCPERIVTVTGSPDAIHKAFKMITDKFEEDLSSTVTSPTAPKPPVTLRLIVPASQCGSIIGKGGKKIQEIREGSRASIQVASEMLPSSTERAVTVSGTPEAITKAIYQVCCVMLESPPKGATIPYRPKPASTPVMPLGAQVRSFHSYSTFFVLCFYLQPIALQNLQGTFGIAPHHHHHHPELHQIALHHQQPSFAFPGQSPFTPAGALAPLTAAPNVPAAQTTQEITIPNTLIGCVIGKGGSKIQEIRNVSGATIKINNLQEGNTERSVTITGTPEAVTFAQYLISASLEIAKGMPSTLPTSLSSTTVSPFPTSPSHLSSTPSSLSLNGTFPPVLSALSSTATLPPGMSTDTITTSTSPSDLLASLQVTNFLKATPLMDWGSLSNSVYTSKLRSTANNSSGSKKFTPY
ncbi:Poly(rC)-binding protein 3 [Holothuria leucospilota]|uniref:Poly(RC)-binding protein 3 n=1 Tax=Holothuria leucospilota TaxID=206669 RepID=A0A9Q1H4V9_HOLLE|nr:Poly(rC)-binding protein 3 [Holothuria leucospilota]